MQVLEREFSATQPLAPEQKEPRQAYRTRLALQPRMPRTTLQALLLVVRAETAPALVMPVLVGTALAWWETDVFNLAALVMALVGLLMSGWGYAALRDHADYCFALQPGARLLSEPLVSGCGLMQRAILKPATVRDLGRILLAIGALCSLWLALMAGWPALFFTGLSFLILWTTVLLPLRYGLRGWGLGEAGIFLGLGLLPLLGSYYVQEQTLSPLPLIIGVPFALLTTLFFFNYNAVHFRRDWLIHKRTLTVNLGLARSLDISALTTVLAHIGILLGVVLTDLPLGGLVTLAALPLGLGVFAQLERTSLSVETCLQVYRTSVHAVALAGSLFCASLLLDKLF
ncbi:MAG: prenyltransferase [Caldilineaceae bacterium]|nr:prenyltransferase [Caldilineaceae bacterium]